MADPDPLSPQNKVVQLAAIVRRKIEGGSGGPHNPGMEARVAKFEESVTAMRLELAEIKGKISNLPTTWQLLGVNLGLEIGVAGLVFAVARAIK